MTPLGLFVDHRLYLDEILATKGLSCDQVEQVGISYQNTIYDMLLSFVPFFSRKTVYVYGKLRKEALETAPKEKAKSLELKEL